MKAILNIAFKGHESQGPVNSWGETWGDGVDPDISRLTKIAAVAMGRGEMDLVRMALRELEALRLSRAPNVADIDAARRKRGRR